MSVKELEFKFSLAELIEHEFNLSNEIVRLIARKSDANFQDMKSINRTFNKFFQIDITKSQDVENIIASQALRHAIVHNGEQADDQCLNHLKSASSRDLVKNIKLNEVIKINKSDLNKVSLSMLSYIESLVAKLMSHSQQSKS